MNVKINGVECKVIGETSWQTRMLVQKVVEIMARRKMTRIEFARRLGVRPSYVTKLLSGRENMTVKTMEKMAEIVGCEVVITLRRRRIGHSDPKVLAALRKRAAEESVQ